MTAGFQSSQTLYFFLCPPILFLYEIWSLLSLTLSLVFIIQKKTTHTFLVALCNYAVSEIKMMPYWFLPEPYNDTLYFTVWKSQKVHWYISILQGTAVNRLATRIVLGCMKRPIYPVIILLLSYIKAVCLWFVSDVQYDFGFRKLEGYFASATHSVWNAPIALWGQYLTSWPRFQM